jgi:hypothetical protein
VTRELQDRYRKCSRKEKTVLLNELIQLTDYNRSYAGRVLRRKEILGYLTIAGKRVKYVAASKKRKKSKYYDQEVLVALTQLWEEADSICSQRLAPFLAEFIPVLEKYGEIKVTKQVKEKLFTISAATIDRLLAPIRKKQQMKGKSTTRPGSLFKKSIPIRTFSQWEEDKPGFLEVDLVSHDGGNLRGDVNQSVNFTDIATGWMEMIAVQNKAQRWVFAGIKEIRKRLPFPILGFDSDNGSEFINDELWRYGEKEHITFTRSRPYRKNDSCYIEQKNWSVIRRTVGYGRYDSDKEVGILNKLYGYLRLYVNFFQPVRKLVQKERIGSRIIKRYDVAQTPFRRVLASAVIPEEIKMKLQRQYDKLNPAELKRQITKLQNELLRLNVLKQKVSQEAQMRKKAQSSFEYIST